MSRDESHLLRVYQMPIASWLLLAVGGGLLLVGFRQALEYMAHIWMNSQELSHGALIPFVVVFLIWQRKQALERVKLNGNWAGVVVILLGAGLNIIGQLASLYILSQYGFLFCIYGLVLALVGWSIFKQLWAPLLLLVFMIPIPDFLLRNFSAELQLVSSQIGVWVIRVFGISVYLEGNVIDLGVYRLQVAEACDGLRYLFPLMTIAFIMAYFFKVAMWKRVLLFVSSVPVTILMNSLRVGAIGIMVEHWGIGMAEGFMHEFQGWAVFMLSASLMLLEMIVLARIGRDGRPWRQVFGLEFPAPLPKGMSVISRPVPPSLVGACIMLVVAAVASLLLPKRTEVVPARTSFVDFPLQVAQWSGRRGAIEDIYLDTLKLDDYLMADFRSGSDAPVNFYVAWYDSQQAGRSAHSPRSCLPGGGWQIKEFDQVEVPGVAVDGVTLRVNRALIAMGPNRQLVYYWFQQRGRVLTNEYLVKWYLFWDSLTRRRSDGALVRLTVPLSEGQDVAEADRQLADFARETAPLLRAYVPR